MAKKGDRYYYDNFIACVDCSLRAATLLGDALKQYKREEMASLRKKNHEIEHVADRMETVIMKNS